jgi:hypothetical protein
MSDVENVAALSNQPVVVDSTTKEKEKREQNLWKPTKKSTLKDGKQIVWHPFVEESNLKDKYLLLHLLSVQPMHAGHGASTIWEQMVADINREIGPDFLPVFSQPLTVCGAKDCHVFLMKFAQQHQGIVLNHSTGNDSMPEATEMQRLLEAVLEILDNKQSKAEIGGSKGNRSYAQKKRDKVDGEAVRSENVTCFAMSVDENTSSGEKIVPKKAKKASPSDSISGLQEMAEKKHDVLQQKIKIAGKKLDFAERKEERRSTSTTSTTTTGATTTTTTTTATTTATTANADATTTDGDATTTAAAAEQSAMNVD